MTADSFNGIEDKKLRIGVLGGSFDPVHMGHQALGKAAIAEAELDRLIVMPAGNPRSHEVLEKNGIKVIPVGFDEIMKGFGAIHCCTAFLKRG